MVGTCDVAFHPVFSKQAELTGVNKPKYGKIRFRYFVHNLKTGASSWLITSPLLVLLYTLYFGHWIYLTWSNVIVLVRLSASLLADFDRYFDISCIHCNETITKWQ